MPVVKMWARQASIASVAMTARKLSEAELWHQRLGHLSYETMAQMVNHGAVKGLSVSAKALRKKAAAVCNSCDMAKHAAKPHPQSDSRSRQALELVHSDLIGPFDVESAGGNKYILMAIDDFSGVAAVKPLKHKSEASAELKAICIRWERESDWKLKKLRNDRGPEYNAIDAWCAEHYNKLDKSVAYTAQQNGRAERFNRTITELVRAMLNEQGIAKKYWAEEFAAAIDIYNISPRLGNVQTPWELFYGTKPDVRSLRTFGCEVYCRKTAPALTKLGERSERSRLMDREPSTKGWRVLLETGSVVIRYDCIFVEGSTVEDSDTANSNSDSDTGDEDADARAEHDSSTEERQPKRTLPPRTREPSKRLRDAYALMCQVDTSRDEPATLQEALAQEDGDLWQQAADEEMRSLRELGVYELVEKPEGVKLLKNKWVLKIKRDQSGNTESYKAHLVAKGFTQREGIDYNQTFAPVARHATKRALLAKAAVEDLEVEQIDVKTAFLNGPLKEEIYMEPPEGYNFGNKVLILRRALCGLKQAARAWNDELKRVLHAEHVVERRLHA
jgi:transposase InsO family protein